MVSWGGRQDLRQAWAMLSLEARPPEWNSGSVSSGSLVPALFEDLRAQGFSVRSDKSAAQARKYRLSRAFMAAWEERHDLRRDAQW
jgi:hypothetical protein